MYSTKYRSVTAPNSKRRLSDVRYAFRMKQCSVRLYLQLFVGGLMFYLRYLYCLRIVVVYFALFVFVLCLVYPMLPVSLDYKCF
jgi:hypothetical protein